MSGLDRVLLVVFACLGLSWAGIAAYMLVSRMLFDLRLGSLRTGRVLVPAKLAPAPRPVPQPAALPAPVVAAVPALAVAPAAASPVVAPRLRRDLPARRKPVPVGAAAGTQLLQ